MKKLVLILLLSHCHLLNAQTDSSYQLLLKNISEVKLTDSLLLNAIELQAEPLDTFSIKKWFINQQYQQTKKQKLLPDWENHL